MSGVPSWAQAHEPLKISDTPSYASTADVETERRARLVFWICKVSTLALCVLMFITALMGLSYMSLASGVGKFFIAIYMIFFSVLLSAYEVLQLHYVESIDFMFRRNFGFLYDTKGKAFFIIFVAFLSFGLSKPEGMSIACGILFCGLGASEVALYLKYPELFDYSILPTTQQA
jgi:hypothetical protein